MFENVDGQTDAGVNGILIAHLGAFGSGELTMEAAMWVVLTVFTVLELNISIQRMIFPKIFISVQEAKEYDVMNDILSPEQGVRI